MVVKKEVKNFPRKKKDKHGNVVKTYDVLRIDVKKQDGLDEGDVWILNQQEFEEFQLLKEDGFDLSSYENNLKDLEEENKQLKKTIEDLNQEIQSQNMENILQEIQELKSSMETNLGTLQTKNDEIIKLKDEIQKLKNNNKHILTIFKKYIELVGSLGLFQRIKSSTIEKISESTKEELKFYDETLFLEGDGTIIDES